MAEFIWLDGVKYPEYIKNDEGSKFCIVRFSHEFCAPRVEKIRLKVCADAKYTLYVNGEFIGIDTEKIYANCQAVIDRIK